MGCSSSTTAQNPSSTGDGYNERAKWNDDNEFVAETRTKRKTFDKKKGKAVEVAEPTEKPETDFFEPLEAGQGEQFMAVRPYIGAIMEPTNHPAADPSPPSVQYKLEYVYGYRCADSRQNVYFNSQGQAVYMTAALGVILDTNSNTQQFFGGGQVDNTSKKTANDQNGHTNDIMCVAVNESRTLAISGQVGSSPAAFVWDSATGQKKQRFKLDKGARGINAVAFSNDDKYAALVDLHNDHNIYVYDISSGDLKWKDKGDTNKIFDLAFSGEKGSYKICSVGSKHIKFWDAST